MNDFEKAAKNIGNRFDFVLVASERMREIHKQRREKEEASEKDFKVKRHEVSTAAQAIYDIEDGKVGIEYLDKIKVRHKRRKPRILDL